MKFEQLFCNLRTCLKLKSSGFNMSANTFYAIHFQVQLQEETLEEDKAWPVNMRVTKDPPPSLSTSAGATSGWAWSQEGSRVIWSSCFVQTLSLCSCLTIKDLWSNITWLPFCVVNVQVMCMFDLSQRLSVLWVVGKRGEFVFCFFFFSTPRKSKPRVGRGDADVALQETDQRVFDLSKFQNTWILGLRTLFGSLKRIWSLS